MTKQEYKEKRAALIARAHAEPENAEAINAAAAEIEALDAEFSAAAIEAANAAAAIAEPAAIDLKNMSRPVAGGKVMEKMENVTYMQAGPVLIIGLPEEVDDHVCNGIREETDRYISAGKVQKLIFDFSKTGFMDSSGIGILLGRYKRMHHIGGEVLVTGEDAKIRRLLRISGVYQVVGTL